MSTTAVRSPAATEVDQWLSRFERCARSRAMPPARLSCSARRATGATWSRSRGTSRRSRAAPAIRDMLEHTLAHVKPRGWHATEEPISADGVTEAWIAFETEVGPRQRPPAADRRQGVDAADDARRAQGPRGGPRAAPAQGRARTAPTRSAARGSRIASARPRSSATPRQPYVVIIGGGQGGIALGARLRQLQVPTIIVERNARPGDSWRKRYKSLCLHDPVWYDHLPYIKFPPNWPVFSPKDKIADWLEMYTRVMELNYWGSTTATQRALRRGRRRVDPRRSSATGTE